MLGTILRNIIRPLAMRIVALVFSIVPLLARAEGVPDMGSSLLQLVLGFGIVLAMLFGCLWLLKRISAPRGSAAGAIRVLSGAAVGPRERVVLVEIGEQWLVLGVAPGHVSKLHELPKGSLPDGDHKTTTPDFSAWLKRTLERRNAG